MTSRLLVFASAAAVLAVASCAPQDELASGPLLPLTRANVSVVEAAGPDPEGLSSRTPETTAAETTTTTAAPAAVATTPVPPAPTTTKAPAPRAPTTQPPATPAPTTQPPVTGLPTRPPVVPAGASFTAGPDYHSGGVWFVLTWSPMVDEAEGCRRIQAALDAAGARVFYPGCDDGRGQFESDLNGLYTRVMWDFGYDTFAVAVFPEFPPR